MSITTEQHIPYPALAAKVFPETIPGSVPEQKLIPFLGAGVSVSGRPRPVAPPDEVKYPGLSEIDAMATALALTGPARVFFSAAVLLSCHLQSRESLLHEETAKELFDKLVAAPYPPTASELAIYLSRDANYSSLAELVPRIIKSGPLEPMLIEKELLAALVKAATLTGIGWPADALSTIAAYCEQQLPREDLWSKLQQIFHSKKDPTHTHALLAKAAGWHVERSLAARGDALARDPSGVKAPKHYLIVTTNYDLLMEKALENMSPPVPYVVLSHSIDTSDVQKPVFQTRARFSPGEDRDALSKCHPIMPTSSFVLDNEIPPRVIIYKIHGCVDESVTSADEGLVISDNDYVNFISQKEALPGDVTKLIQRKQFLFLGYSLSDWNVRSIFESIRRQRALHTTKGDFCVNWQVKTLEMLFFEKNGINVFLTDLNDFSKGILRERG